MLNLTYKDRPSEAEYLTNISHDRRVFFDTKKVRQMMEYEKALAETESDLTLTSFCTGMGDPVLDVGDESKFGGSARSKDLILAYLRSELGKGREYMLSVYDKYTRDYRESLSKEEVLKPIMDSGVAVEFLSEFISFREHNKAAKDMAKRVRERFEPTCVPGIAALTYEYKRAITGRYYTNNDNIQNITKLYLEAMTGLNDDYLLVWGDFDQIDLRVAYYTVISESEEDDVIFEQYPDKYEAMARIIDRKLNREFNLEKFKENRKKYKRGILARCYGQSLRHLIKTVGDKDFATMLDSYYKNNARYSSWYDSVIDLIRTDDYVDIYTYFGNKCAVSLTDCNSSDQKVDRILNCPIQSTSNDIIAHMVNKTVRDMRKAGLTPDQFRVYMIRHDEPIFMIRKDALQYLNLIRRNTIIQVDDWGPLTMTLEIGKYYSVNEYEKYEEYFGDEDIASGAVKVARDGVYVPFDEPSNVAVVKNRIRFNKDTGVLSINDEWSFDIDTDRNIMYQVNEGIARFALNEGEVSTIFSYDPSEVPFKLRDIFVNGVTLRFHVLEVVS